MNIPPIQLVTKAYTAFNTRQIDDVLELLHKDVEWPNGWEGGYLYGRIAVKDYWTRQWKELDPEVLPTEFNAIDNNTVKVTVAQKVKDLQGKILIDKTVFHTYYFKGGLIKKMEIEE